MCSLLLFLVSTLVSVGLSMPVGVSSNPTTLKSKLPSMSLSDGRTNSPPCSFGLPSFPPNGFYFAAPDRYLLF